MIVYENKQTKNNQSNINQIYYQQMFDWFIVSREFGLEPWEYFEWIKDKNNMLYLNKDETCFYMKHVMYGFLRNCMQREKSSL